jgi:hypothetical protein
MIMDELKKNIFIQLVDTLSVFSSESEQLAYKKKVPFVHIPEELYAQWESYRLHFYESGWLSQWIDASCLDALISLDKEIQKFFKINGSIEDVPSIFANQGWKQIGIHSQDIAQKFLSISIRNRQAEARAEIDRSKRQDESGGT